MNPILSWVLIIGLLVLFLLAWLAADVAAERRQDRRDETAQWQAMRDGFERDQR